MSRTASAPPQFSTGRSILYSAVIVLAFLGTAEAVARLVGVKPAVRPALIARSVDVDVDFPFMRVDPELMWAPKPGFRGTFLDRPVTINALGLRGPDVQRPKPAGRRRIACFGDSITFGYGVGDDETYAARLERRLRPRGVEVLNAGTTGYTTHQVLRLLPRVDDAAELDVATFLVGWNDATMRPVDDRTYASRMRSATALEGLAEKLHLYRLLRNLYVRTLLRRSQQERGESQVQRVGATAYGENLRSLVAECGRRGIQPVFLDFPRRRKAGEPAVVSGHADVMRAVAAETGVPLVDVGLLDARAATDNERFFVDNLHLSPAGHEYLAERLATRFAAW